MGQTLSKKDDSVSASTEDAIGINTMKEGGMVLSLTYSMLSVFH